MRYLRFGGSFVALTASVLAIAACATAQQTSAAGDPVPQVQNCANIGVSSPTKYVCNGKVYTSYKLQQMRENAAKRSSSRQNVAKDGGSKAGS